MSSFTRIFIAMLLSVSAVWTTLAWGNDDPHLGVPRSSEAETWDISEWDPAMDLDDEAEVAVNPMPIEVPQKPTKPSIPPLFGAATESFQQWDKAADLPKVAPNVERKPASLPKKTETDKLTETAIAEEEAFHEQVMEASVVPGTYRKILDIMSGGRVRPRPIE